MIVLALVLLVATAFLLATRTDPPASDPIWYAAVAHDIANDPARVFSGHEAHPFVMRVGLTVPLAALYNGFGTTPLVSALPSVFASLLTLVVGFFAASTWRGRALVMLFLVTSGPLLRHSTELGVDLPCGALLALSVLCLHRRAARPSWWLVAGVVIWFAAFLVKETAIWLVPVWTYAVAVDQKAHGTRGLVRMYAPSVVTGLVLTIAYLAWCNSVWGTPLARAGGIETLHHEWSLAGQPAQVWLERLTWRPVLFYVTLFKGALVLVVVALFTLREHDKIWAVAAVTLVGAYWIAPSSLTSYSPLPLIERMGLVALPCALVAAGLVLDALWSRRLVVVAIALATLVPFLVSVTRHVRRGKPETDVFLALREEVYASPQPIVLVCTDTACPALTAYYFGFAIPPHMKIIAPHELACRPDIRARTLVNTRRSSLRPARLPVVVAKKHVVLYDACPSARSE